jgi:hypothetical protein
MKPIISHVEIMYCSNEGIKPELTKLKYATFIKLAWDKKRKADAAIIAIQPTKK